jgi:hypothetical protein
MKYKVGDKVRVRNWDELSAEFNNLGDGLRLTNRCFNFKMKQYCGKVVKITDIGSSWYKIAEDKKEWYWDDDMFEPVNTQKIVITSDGVETLARLYDGNKVIKTATAKCSPEDTFDFEVGAKLAYDRLMAKTISEALAKTDSNIVRRFVDALGNKKPDPAEKKWRVVDRRAKVGDYIRIKGTPFPFNRDGEILKVDRVGYNIVSVYGRNHKRNTGGANTLWNYWIKTECEVVEPVEEKPKYYNGKVVCVEKSAHYMAYTVGKVYEFKDGRVKIDNGNIIPAVGKKAVSSVDEWNNSPDTYAKFIPFVE